jgi:hypothetical protein
MKARTWVPCCRPCSSLVASMIQQQIDSPMSVALAWSCRTGRKAFETFRVHSRHRISHRTITPLDASRMSGNANEPR